MSACHSYSNVAKACLLLREGVQCTVCLCHFQLSCLLKRGRCFVFTAVVPDEGPPRLPISEASAATRLSNGRATSTIPDNMPGECLKYAPPSVHGNVARIFNLFTADPVLLRDSR